MAEPLIVPDVELARVAVQLWDEPSGWQARRMVCIAIVEHGARTPTGVDVRANYYNTTGIWPETYDRGAWAINEEGIRDLYARTGRVVLPQDFADTWANAEMASNIWNARLRAALTRGDSWPDALGYAYSAWNVYRNQLNPDPRYDWIRKVWPTAWFRATNAVLGLLPS